ncbi:MAG: hypothetical protein U9R11_04675 [Chloroflexota bacterium]|nr:hypothetical protein [Chloroflexota bacterium]
MASEALQAKLRADQIEGLRELISQIILEERDELVPVSLLQDVEEIKRSPVGAVIRMEGSIERLEKDMAELKRTVATKEELAVLANKTAALADKVTGIEGRMATKEGLAGLEKRVDLLRTVFFALLTLITGLQVAILIKLFL